MREHDINKLDNFICGWYLEDKSICDTLINHHKSNPTEKGAVIGGVKLEVKNSLDLVLSDMSLLNQYTSDLQLCVNEYIKKYKWCDEYAAWGITQLPNIQKYEPNGGFYAWHTERVNGENPAATRHLVFMTYLNDVEDAGETEFYYQKIKIKPEKGLTIIWPADWTFTHRGIPSPSEEKYIITGWFNFIVK